jgi:nucleoside-diphosphate-sugar epimerase
MNVLITGASGFIGTNLLKKLSINKRYKILTLSRKKTFYKPSKNIKNLKSDLDLSPSSISLIKIFSPQIIIHLAWQDIPDYSKKNSQINFLKQKSFFEKIYKIKSIKKIIVTGSCSEHRNKHHLTSEFFVNSKLKIKKLIKKQNKNLVWLKLFFVFGKKQRKNSLIPFLISSIKKNKLVKLKKPNTINDFIHVNDVSKFILSHLNKIKENLEYDVGSGYGLKVLDIMNFYKKINKDKNNKIRKYTKCFKANIPNNKLKIKIETNKNLKLMMY